MMTLDVTTSDLAVECEEVKPADFALENLGDKPTEEIRLIPMGAACIRISAFPVSGNPSEASEVGSSA